MTSTSTPGRIEYMPVTQLPDDRRKPKGHAARDLEATGEPHDFTTNDGEAA